MQWVHWYIMKVHILDWKFGLAARYSWYIVWWVRDYPSFFVSLDEFVDPDFLLLRTLLRTSSEKSGRNSFPDAGRREFSAWRNQSTSSSTAEPLSKGREICTITSRKTMIHDPDTSTFNSVDIYDELRRACDILCRHDDKGLGPAPCPSEFVDRNICGRTREYVRYVYYARTRRYVSVVFCRECICIQQCMCNIYSKCTPLHEPIYVHAGNCDWQHLWQRTHTRFLLCHFYRQLKLILSAKAGKEVLTRYGAICHTFEGLLMWEMIWQECTNR